MVCRVGSASPLLLKFIAMLRVEGVSKRFDGVQAVDGVSFDVRQGEIFGLLGPNGAGKTTLIRMILDIIKPDRGAVHFASSEGQAGGPAPTWKDKVGYLPEERGLYEERKVSDTLLYFASLKHLKTSQARERIRFWLERLSLEEHFGSKIKELSKGMQQKVQFIAAVLHEPQLVILDEPFAGLDPVNQDLFQSIIQELRARGTTILLSSHQMNLVENLCDRIFLINRGQEVLSGDLREIKRSWGEAVVKIEYRGDFDLKSCPLVKTIKRSENTSGRQRAELILRKGVTPNEFLKSITDRLDIEELAITKPPLHHIFVELVRGERDA